MDFYGDVSLTTVNGKDIRNLTTLHSNQTIKSVIEFQGSVVADQDVLELEYLNDINIQKWNDDSVSLNKAQVRILRNIETKRVCSSI